MENLEHPSEEGVIKTLRARTDKNPPGCFNFPQGRAFLHPLMSNIFKCPETGVRARQSRTQSPQALWTVVSHQERLWSTGILLPQDFCGNKIQAVTEQSIKKF